jgi:hypothetical protein
MLKISFHDKQRFFPNGEAAQFDFEWQLDSNELQQSIEIELLWYTMGKGTTDRHVEQTASLTADGQTGLASWKTILPRGPLSFEGTLISLQWEIQGRLSKTGESTSELIDISPTKRELRLGDLATESERTRYHDHE